MRRLIAILILFPFVLITGSAAQTAKRIIRVKPDLRVPFSSAVKAGEFIYVSGTMATGRAGQVIAEDVRAQTRRTLENAAAILKAAGSSLANVMSVNVYLKNASDFQAMNEIYRTFWPNEPPARTTIASNLVFPDALVEMAMVAVPKGVERIVAHPSDWIQSPNPYSYGVRSGDTLFLSGLVSRNGKDNSIVTGDTKTQTKTVLDNAGEILKAAGMNYGDVVSSRVFITDTALFQDMNTTYRTYFPKNPPARATVQAALMGPQFVVEITLVAVRRGPHEAFTTPNADGSPGKPSPNFSNAIRVDNRLYVCGMMGITQANKTDIRGQTRETMVLLGRTLKAAGFDWRHVVDAIAYITDVQNFAGMSEAYREIFPKDFPAGAAVETGLVNPDGLVEIMLTAVK